MTSMLSRALLALALLAPAAPALAADACPTTDTPILSDAAGDWSGDLAQIAGTPGAGTPEEDLLSLSLSQSTAADGGALIQFKLKVSAAPATLLPNAGWFVSFDTPDEIIRGVRLQTDGQGTPTIFSYAASPSGLQGEGATDGRFIAAGSETPAEAGSGFDASGVLTIIVKASNIGVESGQTLGPFNAASMQGADLVAVGLAETTDQMPDGLSRDGIYDICAGEEKSGSGLTLGGGIAPLSLGTLGWFAFLLTLRRSRRSA
jgi:hypothetical protein